MARGHQPRGLPLPGREREPARGRGAREIVRLHLGDVAAELLEGTVDIAREARFDGFLERRLALAHDLVHHRALHARALQLREGLAGVDGIELLLVAHQDQAGDAQRVGDSQQIACLRGGGERALVYHQHRLPELGPHAPLTILREPALRDACVAGEEALKGLARDACLGIEGACRRGLLFGVAV